MGLAKYKFFLAGNEINPPRNWRDVQILATFDQGNTQANISTEEFEFVNESAKFIRDYITGGIDGTTTGIFEGLPFTIQIENSQTVDAFEGYLDFNTYEEVSPVEVKCAIKKTVGLNSLDLRSQANSFGYLENIGRITVADYVEVPYIVEKLNIGSDLATINIAIFLLTIQLVDLIKENAKDIADVVATITGGVTGTFAAAVQTIAIALANVIFTLIALAQLINLVEQLVELLVPPVRKHKAMTLRKLFEKAADWLGYTFVSPIEQLDRVVYLPSKPSEDDPITKGIPSQTDFGYRLSEIFELGTKLFNARLFVVGTELNLRSLNDPFLVKTATYQVPDVLDERIKYNNADFQARTFLNFETDQTDDWTVDDFTGTNFEVVTTPLNVDNGDNVLMRGLNDVQIPAALGSRKSEFNVAENLFFDLFGIADELINFFGGNSNLANLIGERRGVLKQSQKIHTVAKLLYMVEEDVDNPGSLKIPENQRELWDAEVLWDEWHNFNSFVSNDFGGQNRVFEEKKIPFGFKDFLATIENSYLSNTDGKQGKIESLKWTLDRDFAISDYWVQEVYTRNLKETFIKG